MGLFTEDALVLRTRSYRESDRLCTLLTRTCGVINAYARGARNLKNKNFASTNQLSYARFTLFSGKDGSYSINDTHRSQPRRGSRSAQADRHLRRISRP